MREYALYKGDDFLFTGTLEECAAFKGVKTETIRYWTTPAYQRRIDRRRRSKNATIVIVLDEDEETGGV